MCVVIVKPKGVEMPSLSELKAAYNHNPHGCGVVSSNGIYWRGMSFNKFCKVIQGISDDDACIIHFRIATHGSHRVSNCHPFVADYKGRKLFFAHNGILPISVKGDMTDSETEFRNILAPAAFLYGLDSDIFKGIVAREIGRSKFAFMMDGDLYLFGDFVQEKGVFYSNMNHRRWISTQDFMSRFYERYPQYK